MTDTRKKSVYFAVISLWGCAWYRCYTPGMQLKRMGHDVVLDTDLPSEAVPEFDVIVMQSLSAPNAPRLMRYAKELGKTTVYDIDDDVWNIHPSNPAYEGWSDPEIRGKAEECLRLADVVTTTTPHLARELRRFNKNVRVLPNMLPAEHWQVQRPDNGDKVILGWAGSGGRSHDLAMLKGVVRELLDRYPNLEFHVTGEWNVQAFPAHDRIKLVETVQIEQLAKLIAPFDIGIAPIQDTKFNLAKSDLKFLEYGILGIPCVASALEPYVHSIQPGVNGFLAKNERDWLKLLSKLIEDRALRQRVGAAAKEFAEARTIDKNIYLWQRTYGL